MSPPLTGPSQATGRHADDRSIVLLCNPRAGGRWKELARILDSDEAKHVRWIVTDSIEDIGPALSSLGGRTRLLCVYGGDGTIQRILDQLLSHGQEPPQLAFLGGGTMNVTSRWCGMGRSPDKNFRAVVRAYLSSELLLKEVPVLEVRQGERIRRGFTFGLGPIVRVLGRYEEGSKGVLPALGVVVGSLSAAMSSRFPRSYQALLAPLAAEVRLDGEPLPYDRYAGVFCNTTGQIHRGVEPWPRLRPRESFYVLAYAIQAREVAALLPLLARGQLPIDPKALIKPVALWKKVVLSIAGRDAFPSDPRYVNRSATRCEVETDEVLYTIDGEVMRGSGAPFTVTVGPTLQLAVRQQRVDLTAPKRLEPDATA